MHHYPLEFHGQRGEDEGAGSIMSGFVTRGGATNSHANAWGEKEMSSTWKRGRFLSCRHKNRPGSKKRDVDSGDIRICLGRRLSVAQSSLRTLGKRKLNPLSR